MQQPLIDRQRNASGTWLVLAKSRGPLCHQSFIAFAWKALALLISCKTQQMLLLSK
jgi:hypothetical protein